MHTLAFSLTVALLTPVAAAQPTDSSPAVLEEVVAVVGDAPLLESDVTLAGLAGLVAAEPGDASPPSRRRVLEARIRLELQFRDLEASGTLYRLELDVDAAMVRLVEHGGGDAQLRESLARAGFGWDELRDLAVRLAAATAYVEQRLRPRVRVTTDELRAAYSEEVLARFSDSGEPPPPFPEVRDLLQRLLTERELNVQIEGWLEAAREQRPVTIFRP